MPPLRSTLLVVLLIACYPASRLLPHAWSWESGPIENLQVLILLAGLGLAVAHSRRPHPQALRMLAMAVVPVWAILVARELSWGAVFLPPLEFSADGPVFSSRMLWYKPVVYPVLALLLAFSAAVAVRYRIDRLLAAAWRQRQFPVLEIVLVVLAMFLSGCAEGHMGCGPNLFQTQSQLLEELVEVVAYLALCSAQWRVFSVARSPRPYG